MKRVKWDPALPTLNGSGKMTDGVLPLWKEQLDDLVRAAAKPHAVDEIVNETSTTITYGLSDGQTLLKVWKKTGRIAQAKLGGCTRK